MIRAVLFDLFETLVTNYDPDYSAAEREPLERLFGDRIRQFEEFWQRSRADRHRGKAGSFRDILVSACREMKIVPDPQLIREANARRIGLMAGPFKTVDPDVAALVKGLESSGLILGVTGDCESEEVLAWRQWKSSNAFADPVFSFQIGAIKPEPLIYRAACRKLSVPPAQTLFVAEGRGEDIKGAVAAGLQAVCGTWFF